MTSADTNDILNRLLILHHRSLAMYLRDAPPWTKEGARAANREKTLRAISADQQRMVDEIGGYLNDRNVAIDYGKFPLSYTALHDLSFDYMLKMLIDHQRRDISRIEGLVAKLSGDIMARALAERALGAAQAHLESLQELAQPAAQS